MNQHVPEPFLANGIYAYWEGENRHWFYDLCWETVRLWNPGATLLSRKDVVEVLGPLPCELEPLYITHHVDWIRKAFIERVGGLWLDMDYICWSDLSPLASAATAFDYIGYTEWQGGWMDNFFAARRGSPILRDAADYALDRARRDGTGIPWLAMATEAMNHAISKHPWSRWVQLPTHVVSPIDANDGAWYANDAMGMDMHEFRSLGFFSSFHVLNGWLNNLGSAKALLSGPSRLGAVLRRALER
jgi:hypothetical protein